MLPWCANEVDGGGHPGQHEKTVSVGSVRTLDVGVETITHDERVVGCGAPHPLSVHRQLRFAGDERPLPCRERDRRNERAIAG